MVTMKDAKYRYRPDTEEYTKIWIFLLLRELKHDKACVARPSCAFVNQLFFRCCFFLVKLYFLI